MPDRFVRIRHFGLLANRARHAKLARCRVLLNQPAPPVAAPESVPALVLRLTGLDLDRCPACPEGRMRRTEVLLPTRPRPVPRWDTS